MSGEILRLDSGLELNISDKGNGETLVFVPGFTFSTHGFTRQLETLSDKYRIILVDPRSHGRSPAMSEGNNYLQHGKDIDALFRHLKLDDVTLIGWSFGALSAWSYVEQYGLGKLRRFVNIDMPPVPLSADDTDWTEIPVDHLSDAYPALLTADGFRGFMEGYVDEVMFQGKLPEAERAQILADPLAMPTSIVTDLFASGVFSNYLETAKQIDAAIPSLHILSEHWVDIARPYVQKHFPKSQIEVLGGHMMFWEYPEKFNALLERFLIK